MTITRLHQKSSFNCNDNLLFILRELTGHSTTQIMGHFLDSTLEAVNCPPNVRDSTRSISVVRQFYPGTPIMYKLAIFVDREGGIKSGPFVTVYATLVYKTVRTINKTYADLSDEISRDLLVEDGPQYVPKHPRVMGPRGAKKRSYRRRF